jgi:hypothetical protein
LVAIAIWWIHATAQTMSAPPKRERVKVVNGFALQQHRQLFAQKIPLATLNTCSDKL